MKDNLKDVGIWGCGSPVETSAEGRSTDRGDSRDQRHYQYLKECKPSVIGVMRLNGSLNAYLQQVNEQADEEMLSAGQANGEGRGRGRGAKKVR